MYKIGYTTISVDNSAHFVRAALGNFVYLGWIGPLDL